MEKHIAIYSRQATLSSSFAEILPKLLTCIPENLTYTVYEDIGYSGNTLDRPGLKTLKQTVANQEVDRIIVPSFCRLARPVRMVLNIAHFFKQHGVEIYSLHRGDPDINTLTSFTENFQDLLNLGSKNKEVA